LNEKRKNKPCPSQKRKHQFTTKDEIKKTKALTPSFSRSRKPVKLTSRRGIRISADLQLKRGEIKKEKPLTPSN